ncbi:DNA-directed RNA polymerases I, II, and III subunit RPABC2-like [Teleopsis dalmanni]|uniref:DNA-directed RNA polymerases I, II, and III subunit RPABC2-like n=1 Tax=Teleopsis dalmanni TaxID=139649 RepID=UPI0018CD6681|nr:DNA-directed RNA polymerases I, II, and III subunit RPABC2-like [Teleopsis dalmanni]
MDEEIIGSPVPEENLYEEDDEDNFSGDYPAFSSDEESVEDKDKEDEVGKSKIAEKELPKKREPLIVLPATRQRPDYRSDFVAIPKPQRRTSIYMTKYERAAAIGSRAQQLAKGAAPLVDIKKVTDPLEIATMELMQKQLPVVVRRYLPSEVFEDWDINELINRDD